MFKRWNTWSWLAAVVLGAGLIGAAPAAAQDESKAEGGKEGPKTRIIEDAENAPPHGRGYVAKAIKELDEDHKLQITINEFYDSGHSSSTNEFEPYVSSLVPVNKAGKKDGVERFYEVRRRNPTRSITWVDGEKHGPETIYDRRGRVIEVIPWVKGEIHGELKTFDAQGNVLSISHYERGVQTGTSKSFDSEGNLIRVVPYRDGQKHGKRIDYWAQTGEPKRIVPYRNGLAHGEVVEYHLNGEVKMRVNTVKGQLHGKQQRFSDEGRLIGEMYWWEGSMVSADEFEAKQAAEQAKG